MKRSEMITKLTNAIYTATHADIILEEPEVSHILELIEAAGMLPPSDLDWSDDSGHTASRGHSWEPEEGWENYELPETPRDFSIIPLESSITPGEYFKPRSQFMAQMYIDGFHLEDIAKLYKVTRERIRQCVAKEYRRFLKSKEGQTK